MRSQIEGSQAVAQAVALCRPEVISAYPISPQTHIVEALSDLVRTGELAPCEYLMVESEFAAMSAAIGASATGARAYTATASQGLLYMAEALFNASGLGLPIVMTRREPRDRRADQHLERPLGRDVAARLRAGSSSTRESNQEAVDLHVQAFKLAEELSVPVMVCMDGFVLTHAFEPVDAPDAGAGRRASCPPFEPRQVLDPDEPVTIGAMVGPEAFTEVRYLAHAKQMQALDLIPRDRGRVRAGVRPPLRRACSTRTAATTPRRSSSRSARCSGRSRRSSTSCATTGVSIGALGIGCFRPWPLDEVRAGARAARSGSSSSRRRSRSASAASSARTCGSRSPGSPRRSTTSSPGSAAARSRSARSTRSSATCSTAAIEPNRLTFLDLDRELVERELQRAKQHRALRPARREHPPRPRRRRRRAALRSDDALPAGQVLPGRQLRGRQPPARRRTSAPCRPARGARTRSRPATAPARAAARRSAPATRSTRRCARPTGG